MTKKQMGTVEVAPNVSMNVGLEARDIVNIHVACKEEELLKQEETLSAEREALMSENGKDYTATKKLVDTLAAETTAKVLGPILERLNDIGPQKYAIETNPVLPNVKDTHITVSAEITGRDKSGRSYGSISVPMLPINMPDNIAAVYKVINKREEQIRKINADLVKIKTDLANIDRMERKARAKLAIMALESTDAGKKMLEGIRRDTMKALPKMEQ